MKILFPHECISGRVNPTQQTDAWRDDVDLLRGAHDYVRTLIRAPIRAPRTIT